MVTGSVELAHRVLTARKWRRVAEVAGLAAGVGFAVTSAESVGNLVQDFFSGRDAGWDLAMGPAISIGAGFAAQFPSFLANEYMVMKARDEHTDLSWAVMGADKFRWGKRLLGTFGALTIGVLSPGGVTAGVSLIPLAGAGASRLGEAGFNARAHWVAKQVLRRPAK